MRDERDAVRLGETTIEYRIRRSQRRRKTVEIRLDGAGVRVAAPARMSREDIRTFVRGRAAWILRKASEPDPQPPARSLVSGEALPYLGRTVRLAIEAGDVRSAEAAFDRGRLRVAVSHGSDGADRQRQIREALAGWYRARAAEQLERRVERWSAATGLRASHVLVRDQRSRWGSCGRDGTLRFNWRLVMAPPAVIDYVVVHELAHLSVSNHSPAFWAAVEAALPDYRDRRSQLREITPRLTL